MIRKLVKETSVVLTSLLFVVFLYYVLSKYYDNLFIPPISKIAIDFRKIIQEGSFLVALTITLQRVLIALFISLVASFLIGIPVGLKKSLEKFFDIPLTLGLSIPIIVFVTISLIIFGVNNSSVVAASVFIVTPLLIVPAASVTKNLDNPLMEMASVFKLSRFDKL